MGTIVDKLTYLANTKEEIRKAIISKGMECSTDDTFHSYADKIRAIEAGKKIPRDYVGDIHDKIFDFHDRLNVSDNCFDLTENISRQIVPYLPLFNYGYFKGLNPLFKNYVCNLNGSAYTNSTSSAYLTISESVICFKNSDRNKRLVFTNPIYNSKYTTLNISAAVPKYISGAWNTCCIMGSRNLDISLVKAANGRFDGQGQSDIVVHKHFTNYTDSSYPNTVEKQTFSLDISDSIGSNIYIGLHSCSNEFDIYSIYLTE